MLPKRGVPWTPADDTLISLSKYPMAMLPYQSIVCVATTAEVEGIQAWCLQTWPHTQGATWHQGLTTQQGPPVWGAHGNNHRRYRCTWSFQREEDQRLFEFAWYDLLVPVEPSA